jgi:proteic killer suppression protein
MIKSFKHKGLQEFFVTEKSKKLPQERLSKIKKLLYLIHNAHQLEDINTPAFRLHKLKAPPYAGWYSVDVSGNFRIVFQFTNGNAYDIDYLDTH